jgi:hypothetical protein
MKGKGTVATYSVSVNNPSAQQQGLPKRGNERHFERSLIDIDKNHMKIDLKSASRHHPVASSNDLFRDLISTPLKPASVVPSDRGVESVSEAEKGLEITDAQIGENTLKNIGNTLNPMALPSLKNIVRTSQSSQANLLESNRSNSSYDNKNHHHRSDQSKRSSITPVDNKPTEEQQSDSGEVIAI